MLVVTVRRSWHRPESVEDQVSANVRRVVQVSEPDLVARANSLGQLEQIDSYAPGHQIRFET